MRAYVRTLVLMAAAGAAGCAGGAGGDEPTGVAASASRGERRGLHSNRERYRERGRCEGRGRAGRAQLAVRALANADGTTSVEVTTGSLDDPGAAPGAITHLLIRRAGRCERAVLLNDHADTGGYRVETVRGLARGQVIEVQALVRGASGRRTDVVTVRATVAARPDLRASDLAAPAAAFVRAPTTIAATVREALGDTGARADCVLYVDGAAVDRAPGIWVDAGGTVSCAFAYAFPAVGRRALAVAVENVAPGDHDAANNVVRGAIEVVPATRPLQFTASAYEYEEHSAYRSYTRTTSVDSAGRDTNDEQGYTGGFDGRSSGAFVQAIANEALAFPLARVGVTEATDGAAFTDMRFEALAADYTDTYTDGGAQYTTSCASRADAAGRSLGVCAVAMTDAEGRTTGSTTVTFVRFAGDVTYQSGGYSRTWSNYDGTDFLYSYNDEIRDATGALVQLGARYRAEVTLEAGGVPWSAAPEVALAPVDEAFDAPLACTETVTDGVTVSACFESTYRRTGRAGSASGP